MYVEHVDFTSFTANLLYASICFFPFLFHSQSVCGVPCLHLKEAPLTKASARFLQASILSFALTFLSPPSSASSVLLFCSLFSLVNTIAQAVSCCRHFVADHGAESFLPSNCQSVHFMLHIPSSPFVRLPLASHLFF